MKNLLVVFNKLRKHQLKKNPLKCASYLRYTWDSQSINGGLKSTLLNSKRPSSSCGQRTSGSSKGCKATLRIPAGSCQICLGDVNISPELLKRMWHLKWDQQCLEELENIKAYVTAPLVSASPIKKKPLMLYITALDHSLSSLLAKNYKQEGKCPVIPQSNARRLGRKIFRYPIKCVWIFAIQRLRHYLQHHHTSLMSKSRSPQNILYRPTLNGRLEKWVVLLQQYDIKYVLQKVIKTKSPRLRRLTSGYRPHR